MIYKRLTYSFLLFVFSFFALSLSAQDAQTEVDIEAGKTLFRNNCASCHNKDMKSKMTGPALAGVEDRWPSREDLYAWIHNSQGLISEGHPRAVEVWNEWKPTVMNSFPTLSTQDIDNILGYIKSVAEGGGQAAGGGGVVTVDPCLVQTQKEEGGKLLYVFLFVVLALLSFILARIISNLNYMAELKDSGEAPERKTFVEMLTSKGVIGFVIFLAIVVGGFLTVNNAINFGRQQGYQPDQPIKFSHIVHACQNQIDCNYCHDGARRSKHAIIPAANTCMNCHKGIKVGTTTGTGEIAKIYASIGYDPSADKYIENYDSLSQEDIRKIFTKWFADQYIQEKGSYDAEADAIIENQWNNVVASLTNKKSGDDKIQGPIEWIRIHNLPDHVYFNHSQHVSVGKIACQTCHGKVETMAVVQQYSPLSMGWCVNCHRKTAVQFAENKYYDNYYEMYHRQLQSGDKQIITVEDIGGTECQKCHY